MLKTQIKKKDLLPKLTQKLKNLEKILDIPSAEIASTLGVKPDTFTRYINATRVPSLTVLANASLNYGLSLDWLILDRGPTYYKNIAPGGLPPHPLNNTTIP